MNCEFVNYVHVKVPMRDGVNLCACVYLPSDASGKYGCIMIRSPYGTSSIRDDYAVNWCHRGIACVEFDTRGRFLSEGVCDPGRDEIDDASDCADWITAQPWSNGRIAVLGGSYLAVTTLSAVASGHPAIVGASSSAITADWYETFYTNGVLELSFMKGWYLDMCSYGVDLVKKRVELGTDTDFHSCLPVRDFDILSGMNLPQWKRIVDHPDGSDPWWRKCSLASYTKNIHTPLYACISYFDLLGRCSYRILTDLLNSPDVPENVKRRSFFIIGPWGHGTNAKEGRYNYGEDSILKEDGEIDFISARLEDREARTDAEPKRIQYFTMVENKWHYADTFPPAGTTDRAFYLASSGSANTRKGNGVLRRMLPADTAVPCDRFIADPADPVPSCGGRMVGSGGQRDQSEVEMRSDVLVYTSPALAEDWNVTGLVRAVLYVSCDKPDADFTLKLVDVEPDGVPMSVCDTIMRVRWSDGFARPNFLKPGEIRKLEFDVDFTSYLFRKGHSVRIEIAGSNFPHYERNLHTEKNNAEETRIVSAEQVVHHNEKYPSCVILPVLES